MGKQDETQWFEGMAPESKDPRGTRLTENWEIDAQLAMWIRRTYPGVTRGQVKEIKFQFVNYWTSKAGSDARKLDWNKTFMNWMLKEMRTRVGGKISVSANTRVGPDNLVATEDWKDLFSDQLPPDREKLRKVVKNVLIMMNSELSRAKWTVKELDATVTLWMDRWEDRIPTSKVIPIYNKLMKDRASKGSTFALTSGEFLAAYNSVGFNSTNGNGLRKCAYCEFANTSNLKCPIHSG
jgi:hypothetical protein